MDFLILKIKRTLRRNLLIFGPPKIKNNLYPQDKGSENKNSLYLTAKVSLTTSALPTKPGTSVPK